MTPNLDKTADLGATKVILQNLDRLEAKPSIDHDDALVWELGHQRPDGCVTGTAHFAVILAVANTELTEQRLLYDVKRQERTVEMVG